MAYKWFSVSDSLQWASPRCAIFAFLRDRLFFGCARGFSRVAKTSALFVDRADDLGKESDGVSLFSQGAGGVSA